MVKKIEDIVFRLRLVILLLLAVVTIFTGYYALQLRMEAGFGKQLPGGHEYIQTFYDYQDELFGANRVLIVLENADGDIWNPEALERLYQLTQDVFFLPGIDRRTVTSLWTPNTRFLEITEEGIRADDVIPGDVTPDSITPAQIDEIENRAIRGKHVGRLVANDSSSAMIVADLIEVDPRTGEKLDYFALAGELEAQLREKYEDEQFKVRIVGFAKLVGDIADGARSVIMFFGLAFFLTALAVYIYSQSLILTFLPLFCSLVSVVWQFGLLKILGYGLDPLAVLVPFLVFAIGVSHGVQQINLITKRLEEGDTTEKAARVSFSGLLIPGTMALVTDLVGFGTLYFIPITMIKELAVTASIGVALKIVTNLVMLPLLVSYAKVGDGYVERVKKARALRMKVMKVFGYAALRPVALVLVVGTAALFYFAVEQSQGRHIGDLHAGAPELHPDARYNEDSRFITDKFAIGLNLMTVVVETPKDACIDYRYMNYVDRFSWYMNNTPGVLSVASLPVVSKQINAGWNEGNPKWQALPRNQFSLVQSISPVETSSRLLNANCTILPVHIFMTDSKAETITTVTAAVKQWREEYPFEKFLHGDDEEAIAALPASEKVVIRLASGNVGVVAATNDVIHYSELPMMLLVYATIILLVFITYRDWRATIVCCVPLTVATFLGYWFMKELEIGLKVATLPVMVLAVGLGVDYAFYIYSRIQHHLAAGLDVTKAYQNTMYETGNAVVFCALTLAVGVFTWSFSDLKFQADMGKLLTFMFMINMIMAITALPAIAVVLDWIFPRRKKVKAPTGALAH